MATNRGIVITGHFSDDELRELFAAVRAIEQRHPEEDYLVNVFDPNFGSGMDQASELIKKTFPKAEGRQVDHMKFTMDDFRRMMNFNPTDQIKPGTN